MAFLSRLLNTFLRRRTRWQSLSEEFAFHLDEKIRDGIQAGLSAAQAREQALRSFGNAAILRDETDSVDSFAWLSAISRDLVIAVRGLARRKALVVTAVLSLGLGIGITTALFSLADSVLFKPLPLPEPDRLVAIVETRHGERNGSNPQRMHDWASQIPAFHSVGGYYNDGAVLTRDALTGGDPSPVRVEVLRTFGRLLSVLAVHPGAGRLFTADEEAGLGQPVALITYRFWKRRYAENPAVLNSALHLNGGAYTVIGILPASMSYPDSVDIIAPAPLSVQQTSRNAGFLAVIGRLSSTATLSQANAQIVTVAGRLAHEYPATDKDLSARAISLQQELSQGTRKPIILLLSAALLVLLIACGNVASLLLARAVERQREAAIRLSLGAGRLGLIRLYLAESFVLSVGGGILGLAIGKFALQALLLLPLNLSFPVPPEFDWRIALFAVALSLTSGLLFGWIPAWNAAFGKSLTSFQSGTRSTSGARSLWLRNTLVIAQVAFSVILLCAVGLAAKSLYFLRQVPLGFQPAALLTFQVNFPWDTPPNRLESFSDRVLANLSATPGVAAAGMVDRLPLGGGSQSGPIAIRGAQLSPELQAKSVGFRAIKGDYFGAAGISLLAGRAPHQRESTQTVSEIAINQTFAQLYFPQSDPLGRLIYRSKLDPGQSPAYFEIVGVVGDVRVTATQAEQPPEVFVLSRDTYWPYQNYIVRAVGDPLTLVTSVRQSVRRVDPEQLIDKIATMRQEIAETSSDQRVRLWLLGSFGAIALLLASIGLYGVLASEVARRTSEIGIRVALGAEPARVLRATMRTGLRLALVGLLIGASGALLLGRFAASLLYGVRPTDPSVLAAVAFVLLGVSAIATYLPARRAAQVDPLVALRHD